MILFCITSLFNLVLAICLMFCLREGMNRGIFGTTMAKKAEIEVFVERLESRNPFPNPTDDLTKVCTKFLSRISVRKVVRILG